MFAHGDLLIIPYTDKAPPAKGDEVQVEHGRVILAHGEVTGHHHSIDARLGTLHRFRPDDMPSPLSVGILCVGTEGAVLEHQEHAGIELPPGDYEVRRQREYDALDEWRRVQD